MDDFKGLIRSQEKISFWFSFCYEMFNSYEKIEGTLKKNNLFSWKSTKGGF